MFKAALWVWIGVLLCACGDVPGVGPVAECSGSVSCQTDDCYAECFCTRGETDACEQACGARGQRVEDLDEESWMEAWVAREDEVISLTNAAREKGACCGGEGCFKAAPALELDSSLRRAARAHALDMAERGYFAHETPEGRTPFDRMREARFRGCAMGENIAAGQPSAAEVVRSWLGSAGHCANMLSPVFDRIGVGYRPSAGGQLPHVWVQNFGAQP
jgi:uncharacterized protein YkwD